MPNQRMEVVERCAAWSNRGLDVSVPLSVFLWMVRETEGQLETLESPERWDAQLNLCTQEIKTRGEFWVTEDGCVVWLRPAPSHKQRVIKIERVVYDWMAIRPFEFDVTGIYLGVE